VGYGITLKVWGERACFTRPEMKSERVSYDVITPSAARGILEAIMWKPAIRWVVDEITVLNPIVFDSARRNEVGSKIPPRNIKKAIEGNDIDLHQYITEDRQQRATLYLKDVAYLINAHFEMVPEKCGEGDNEKKFYNIFLRRARSGQCYKRPYFGCREFPVMFSLIEEERPKGHYHGKGERDLGWMLYDIDYSDDYKPYFFRAVMKDGVIKVSKEEGL
jgi:CRISPR-associated protein Cas5d